MTERTIKIKELIHDEVCMGTYGLVELELLEIEKEMEALRQLAVSKSVCCKCNSDYILLQGNYNECGKCGYVW